MFPPYFYFRFSRNLLFSIRMSELRLALRPSLLRSFGSYRLRLSALQPSPPPKKNLPRISARLFGSRHLPLSMPFCKTTILKLNCLLVHLSSPAYEVHICSAACRRNISSRVDFSMNINRQPSLLPNLSLIHI